MTLKRKRPMLCQLRRRQDYKCQLPMKEAIIRQATILDLTVTVSAGGTVATTDNKINCDSSNSPCKHSYGKNGTVTLKATPSTADYSFEPSISNWGNCDKMMARNNGCQVKMTKNRTVNVKFTPSSSSFSSSSSSSSYLAADTVTTPARPINITSNLRHPERHGQSQRRKCLLHILL